MTCIYIYYTQNHHLSSKHTFSFMRRTAPTSCDAMDVERAKHLFDLGEISVHIARFLNLSQISCCEAAHFFPSKAAAAFLWHKAAEEVLSKVPIWGPSGHAVIQQLMTDGIEGKALLRELGLLRRAIFPPKSWLPEVVEKSFCSAVVPFF